MRIKSIFVYVILVVFCGTLKSQNYSKVKIFIENNNLQKISSLGIPVEGEVKKEKYLITEISENDLAKLEQNKISYEVLINDVSTFYAQRNINAEKMPSFSKSGNCSSNSYSTPSHFMLGSLGGFLTYDEMLEQLDSMHYLFPNLITVKQQIGTGLTIENQPLYYVRLSDNASVDESEPEVLYSALTHAREPMGMQQLIFYMWFLLENYASNPEIQGLVNNTEMYFVPCVNVDGYKYNELTNPGGGGMWRKNRRNNGSGSYGVDLNRNYGYMWGYDNTGSSNVPTDETYRGTAGFSEPETQIMKWFCEHRQFVTSIDYHCFGNYLIYPWGYESDLQTNDSTLYKEYSKLMGQENGYVFGTPNQTVGYSANGGSFDWFYGEQGTKGKIISWSPEAGDANDGFWPAMNRIEDIAKGSLLQNLYVARFAGRYAEISNAGENYFSQLSNYFTFDIKRLGMLASSFTLSVVPLSSNISSVGPPLVFNGMNLLETRKDSFLIALNSSIQNGEIIEFVINVNNGLYTTSDTIKKIFGTPLVLLSDNGSSINSWVPGNWGLSTTQYYSPSSSITDSPSGTYSTNANKSITLSSSVNLANAALATLSFWAKWDIEPGFDYVQVKVSSDNGATWIPLCGKYTKMGSSNQEAGSPLYDGTQNTWVKEEIDLSDFINSSIKLRFTLVSDGWLNMDGFYFDDLEIKVIPAPQVEISENNVANNSVLRVFPNPASEKTVIKFSSAIFGKIKLYNSLGILVFSDNIKEGSEEYILNVSNLASGVYHFCIDSRVLGNKFSTIIVY